MKKILVLTLVATMVLGLAGSGLAAAPKVITTAFSDVKGHEAEGAFAFLGALGVYKGDKGIGGPARPDDPITRAEFAAVVVRAMGKEKTAQSMANYVPDFADAAQIPSWAWGYVKVASTLGLVKGYEDGTFRANDNVRQAEALAMLVRAIGHEPLVKGVWPGNYVTYAYEVGIAGDLEIFANMPATRGEVAQMVKNAMGVVCYNAVAEKFVDPDEDGEIDDNEDEAASKATLRAGALRSGWQLWKGTVASVSEDDAKITLTGGSTVDLASQVVLAGVSKLSDLVNYDIEAVGKSGKAVYVAVTETPTMVAGVIKNPADATDPNKDDMTVSGSVYKIRVDGDKWYELVSGAKLFFNGAEVATFAQLKTKADAADAYADPTVSLALNADGKAVTVRVEGWSIYDARITADPEEDTDEEDDVLATVVVVADDKATSLDEDTVKVLKDTKVELNGQAASWADLQKNMSVYVMLKGGTGDEAYKIAAYDSTVTGKVKSSEAVWTSATDTYVKVVLEVDGVENYAKLFVMQSGTAMREHFDVISFLQLYICLC